MVVELTTELRAYPPRGWKTREEEGSGKGGSSRSESLGLRARTTIIRVITGMNIHRCTRPRAERKRERRGGMAGGKRYLHCEFSSSHAG